MPLTISLLFPAGRYAAASWDDTKTPEWPPHPARFCLGLLDTLHRAGNPEDLRDALTWLCGLDTPEIVIPDEHFADPRRQTGFFVPQNPTVADDVRAIRKERAFPVVFVDSESPTVFFHWSAADPSEKTLSDLSDLLAQLPRFGHSSSLVIARVTCDPCPTGEGWTRLAPSSPDHLSTPEHQIRVPWDGLLASAEASFDADGRRKERQALVKEATRSAQPSKSLRPKPSPRGRHDPRHLWHGYSEASGPETPSGPWDRRLLVFSQTGGDTLGVSSTWQIAEVVHKTMLDRWSRSSEAGPVPPWISGHAPSSDGRLSGPVASTHLTIFPLPFVGREHADGRIMGIGLALPDPLRIEVDPIEFRIQWRAAISALLSEDGMLRLTSADQSWRLELSPESSPKPRQSLRPTRWTRAAKLWQTVTPIILDRHPKPHFRKDPRKWADSCADIVRKACLNLGLPAPEAIQPSLYSPLAGVPHAGAFPAPGPRSGRPPRFHIHATLRFHQKVGGPLLLGAGRYRGYGLCLPDISDSDH